MVVHYPLLVVGVLLLWFPRQWMRMGRVFRSHRKRSGRVEPWKSREPGDPRLSLAEFGKSRNYFDLMRALAGALAIVGAKFIDSAIATTTGDQAAAREVLVLQLGILFIGLLIQTVRYERQRISFYAPLFYLAGMSVVLCGPWAALFAFALVWGVNGMFRRAEGFLTTYGVALAGFGVLFKDTSRLLAGAALLMCLMPVILALLSRRPLVIFSRKPGHGDGQAA